MIVLKGVKQQAINDVEVKDASGDVLDKFSVNWRIPNSTQWLAIQKAQLEISEIGQSLGSTDDSKAAQTVASVFDSISTKRAEMGELIKFYVISFSGCDYAKQEKDDVLDEMMSYDAYIGGLFKSLAEVTNGGAARKNALPPGTSGKAAKNGPKKPAKPKPKQGKPKA